MKNRITIEEFEKLFAKANREWDGIGSKKTGGKISIQGKSIYLYSQRYKLFAEQGYTCTHCGKKGTYFSIDESANGKMYHLNLRAEDGSLITKDHIIPVCAGGKSELSNYQVFCEECNKAKGDSIPEGITPPGFYTEDNQFYPSIASVLYNFSSIYDKKVKKGTLLAVAEKFIKAVINKEEYWGHHWTWIQE